MTVGHRVRAAFGAIGPIAFVAAWTIGGLTTEADYSFVDDAISRLAAVGADSRPLMTLGFIVFGVSLTIYASAMRSAMPGPAWIFTAATGAATLAVAALPLDRSATVDQFHGVAAGIGYLTLIAIPLAAAASLRSRGRPLLATTGLIASTLAAIALAASLVVDAHGLFQRVGLTSVDAWLVLSAPVVATGRSSMSATPPGQ